jgi:hypothetical protein
VLTITTGPNAPTSCKSILATLIATFCLTHLLAWCARAALWLLRLRRRVSPLIKVTRTSGSSASNSTLGLPPAAKAGVVVDDALSSVPGAVPPAPPEFRAAAPLSAVAPSSCRSPKAVHPCAARRAVSRWRFHPYLRQSPPPRGLPFAYQDVQA